MIIHCQQAGVTRVNVELAMILRTSINYYRVNRLLQIYYSIMLLSSHINHFCILTDSRNQFFNMDLSFDVNRLRINCTFLNMSRTSYEKSCTAEFGFGKEGQCAYGDLSYVVSSENSSINTSHITSIEIPILLMKNDVLCFVVTARDDRLSAKVERMLKINSGRSVNSLLQLLYMPAF